MPSPKQLAAQTWSYLRQLDVTDLRWSYFVVAGAVVVSVVANVFLKGGWQVWPFAAGVCIMVTINEASDRAGVGVPPLQVYGLFAAAVVGWIVVVMAMSALNPLVMIAGLGALGYYAGRGYIQAKEKERLIALRVDEHCCIHCGQPADYEVGYCENCGEDPNPSASQLKRVQAVSFKNRNPERVRSVLKQETLGQSAKRKENALLAKRHPYRKQR